LAGASAGADGEAGTTAAGTTGAGGTDELVETVPASRVVPQELQPELTVGVET